MRTSAKTCQKMMSKYHQNLWKMDPGAHHKTMLKNIPQQIEKCSKNDSQFGFIKWLYFRGFASWGTFGGPIHFLTLKVGPSAPKVLPMIENWPKNDTKEPQDCEKELQKTSLFGAWPGGLREALTINSCTTVQYLFIVESIPKSGWLGLPSQKGRPTLNWAYREHFGED